MWGGGSAITTTVVGGSPALRAGIRALLDTVGFGAASEGMGPVRRVVVSLDPPGRSPLGEPTVFLLSGLEALAAISELDAGAPVAYLIEADPPELEAAVRAVAEGLVVLSPRLIAALRAPRSEPPGEMDEGTALTHREQEVLEAVALGLSNREIALRLGISEHTAKFHVGTILGKLGATSRTEAVVAAARRGLIAL